MVKTVSSFVLAIACFFVACTAMASPLQLSVNAGLTAGTVDVSLSNEGASPVSILLWDTPFERTLSHNVFVIERAIKGFPLPHISKYIGRSVKRVDPAEDAYLTLIPGQTIAVNIALNEYYDIKQSDEYSIRFVGGINYDVLSELTSRSNPQLKSIDQLEHVHLESNKADVSLTPNLMPRLRPPSYESCSIEQRADIVNASTIAENLVETAISDLSSLSISERSSSPRYTTWFGTYTDSRFGQVVANFNALDQALANETLEFNCNCSESSTYAYVFPASPYTITLCPRFWLASAEGEDSKSGTIIHELSHFNVIAGTDDHVYGQAGARSLASSNPNLAIANADSYEYFSENTPFIAIGDSSSVEVTAAPVTLPLGLEASDSISQNASVVYEITNAGRVELRSITGDADLYIYEDAALTSALCESTNGGVNTDACNLTLNGTVYVRVYGYADSSYVLVAEPSEAIETAEVTELLLEVPVIRSVEANARHIYRVNGGDVVELQSLSGDADLYMYRNLELTEDALACVSNRVPADSATDSCDIPTFESSHYVLVVGFSAANYTLVARSASPQNAIRLIPGETFTGNLAAGESDYYVISGVDSLVLTSTSGNADLLVTQDNTFTENESSCTSAALSTESATDSCTVDNTNDHYILVRGSTDAAYTIRGSLGSTVPEADDDPSGESIFIGTPSRRGATGEFGLALLLLFVGVRATRKG